MILFKPEHVEPILNGKKTQTRMKSPGKLERVEVIPAISRNCVSIEFDYSHKEKPFTFRVLLSVDQAIDLHNKIAMACVNLKTIEVPGN